MKSFKSFRESMDHKSDGELLKIARSTHPHSAKAMTALKKRGVKVHNPATGKKEEVDPTVDEAKTKVEEEASPTNTGAVVGTGDDVADWKTKKKKRSSVVTRHYIEVNGKRKKQTK